MLTTNLSAADRFPEAKLTRISNLIIGLNEGISRKGLPSIPNSE